MRILPLRRSVFALVAVIAMLMGGVPLSAEASDGEPKTSSLRIRLRGPTLRVRCRAGDCVVTIVGEGTLFHVSITRTQNGAPFTFARTVQNPTNIAIETGFGNDVISLTDVSIPGFLRIASGPGDDVLDISETSTVGKTMIDTGRGNDTVRLEPGTIGGKFRLKTQGGDDDVSVRGGRFEGKSGFDGGPGTDTFFTQTNPFAVPPVIIRFEP